jgi:hypothetical protein
MNEDSLDLFFDLHTVQLYGEGTVRAARPRIHPHSHFSSTEWLDVMVDKDPLEARAHQPTSWQLLDNIP